MLVKPQTYNHRVDEVAHPEAGSRALNRVQDVKRQQKPAKRLRHAAPTRYQLKALRAKSGVSEFPPLCGDNICK